MTNQKNPISATNRGLQLASLDDYFRFGKMMVASHLCPKSFKTAEQVMIAVQYGAELGMTPMASLQGLIVINGKLSMYGDTARALIENDSDCEYVRDDLEKFSLKTKGGDTSKVSVHIKLKSREKETVRSFSVADAKLAGLWGRSGPWTEYPSRMLYYRALGFCARDACPHILKGLKIMEEVRDYPTEAFLENGGTVPPADLDAASDEMESHVVHNGTVTSDEEALERLVDEELAAEVAEFE